jgi:hypothetical protein
MALLGIWFGLIILAVVVFKPRLYDNFRQFLFIVPAIFVFAAIGLESLWQIAPHPGLRGVLAGLALIPGVIGCIRLHPYQYIYYNNLTGGTLGAFRKFESDYWATSYRQATLYLNQHASIGARVVVWGAPHLVKRYARKDLKIINFRETKTGADSTGEYAVIASRHNKDLLLYPSARILFTVSRGGAVLAVVKRLEPDGSP